MRISDWSSDVFSSDLRDLFPGGAFGNDGNKGQAYQPCEISFGHGRGARGGLDDGTVRMQPAITKRIQEEGARQAMLQAAGRVAGLVFQIKIDSRICRQMQRDRSEEHTSELQSLMRISYAVFCLKKKNQ